MIRAVSLALVLTVAAPGIARAEDRRETMNFAGAERSYVLHIPDAAGAAPMPLVIALHGAGADGPSFAGETKFGAAVDDAGMIAVFPSGVQTSDGRGTWNARFCCGIAAAKDIDDVGFIGALIDAVDKIHAIDRAQIYATGMSNGGMLAYRLASIHPEWFAAIAPVSAAVSGVARDGHAYVFEPPALPVSAMIVHGRKDELVLYDGGSSPSLKFPNHWKNAVEDSVSFWAAADNCPPAAGRSEFAEAGLTRLAYRGCKDGSEVVLWTLAEGDHSWPSDVNFPDPNGPRNAAAAIVAFFAAHARK